MTRLREGRWRWAVLGLAAAAAGCGTRAATTAPVVKEAAIAPVPVTVADLGYRPVERTIAVTGTLRGWEQVTVGSKKAGRVARVLHDMGDRVEPGEPLVELEQVDARLAVEQARRQRQAELAKLGLTDVPGPGFDVQGVPAVVSARIALDQARRDLNRVRTLSQRGATSMQELQDSEDKERTAAASLDSAMVTARSALANALAVNVALQVAEQSLKDMTIAVPDLSNKPEGYGGPIVYHVSKRLVSEGQMIAVGAGVYELVIEDPLRLWAKMPERYSGQIRCGQKARVTVAAYPDRVFAGTVARVNPAVEESSRSFQVEIVVPNDGGPLRPGGFAEAAIVVAAEDRAAVVPTEAIDEFAGVTKIFLLEGETARAVPVTKGVEGAGWIEVIGALPPAGRLVTTGQSRLADGTPVVVRRPEPGDRPTTPAQKTAARAARSPR